MPTKRTALRRKTTRSHKTKKRLVARHAKLLRLGKVSK